jgi:hypothetical protein
MRATATATITMPAAAPTGGAVISLSSSNTDALSVPSTVTVTAGSTTATFTVTTFDVASNTNVTVTATYAGNTATAIVAVQTVAWKVASLSFDPVAVYPGGPTTTGTVTLSSAAPSGGARVLLSSDPVFVNGSVQFGGVAPTPAYVDVSSGLTTATFTATGGRDLADVCDANMQTARRRSPSPRRSAPRPVPRSTTTPTTPYSKG